MRRQKLGDGSIDMALEYLRKPPFVLIDGTSDIIVALEAGNITQAVITFFFEEVVGHFGVIRQEAVNRAHRRIEGPYQFGLLPRFSEADKLALSALAYPGLSRFAHVREAVREIDRSQNSYEYENAWFILERLQELVG